MQNSKNKPAAALDMSRQTMTFAAEAEFNPNSRRDWIRAACRPSCSAKHFRIIINIASGGYRTCKENVGNKHEARVICINLRFKYSIIPMNAKHHQRKSLCNFSCIILDVENVTNCLFESTVWFSSNNLMTALGDFTTWIFSCRQIFR